MAGGKQINIKLDEIDWANIIIKNDDKELTRLLKNKDMQLEYYDEYDENGNAVDQGKFWKNVLINLANIPIKKFSELKNINVPFSDVNEFIKVHNGVEGYFSAYNEMQYFAYKYHQINKIYPYIFKFEQFKVDNFIKKLFESIEVPASSHIKVSYQNNDKITIISILIAFKEDLLLYIDGSKKGAIYYNPKDEANKDSFLYTLLGLLKTIKEPKQTKNKIYIVHRNSHGFDKTGFTINKRKVNLEENYNDGFIEISDKIIEGLNDKKKTNLVILSGEAGVGKTNYIRYLVANKIKKNIIFISPDMVESITDPGFIPFLMNNNDSILVIEDAEPALEKREHGGRSSAVSNVLNLTDGLLSDCLKISIIATFNTKGKNVDEALTRKGRLLMHYSFEKLCIEKTQALLKKIGHDIEVKEPMTLADIYFYGTDNNVKQETNKLGFRK
jgi:hypothetical protein